MPKIPSVKDLFTATLILAFYFGLMTYSISALADQSSDQDDTATIERLCHNVKHNVMTIDQAQAWLNEEAVKSHTYEIQVTEVCGFYN